MNKAIKIGKLYFAGYYECGIYYIQICKDREQAILFAPNSDGKFVSEDYGTIQSSLKDIRKAVGPNVQVKVVKFK